MKRSPKIWNKSMAGNYQLTRVLIRFIWLLMPLFFYGCGKQAEKQSANQLFTLMPASVTHADFINHLD